MHSTEQCSVQFKNSHHSNLIKEQSCMHTSIVVQSAFIGGLF